MNHPKYLNVFVACFLMSLVGPIRLTSQEVDLDLATLADGPYSKMDMLLRKGFLFIKVDVARVSVQVGPETAERLHLLVTGNRLNSDVADSIAMYSIRSREALVTMAFARDVDLNRFLSEIRKGAERVLERGIIEQETFDHISRDLPTWYSSLEERGIHEGDRALYRVSGDRLHTVVQAADGTTFVDQVDVGRESVLSVLAGYFVKGSDFRDGLIESLYESGR
jgi:hypothetical protein